MNRSTRWIEAGARRRRPGTALLTVGLVVAVVAVACTGNGSSGIPPVGATSVSPGVPAETIPQPVVTNFPLAPDSARVDIAVPNFSDPTNVTHPLFPVGQESILQLGTVDGGQFRAEVTLLPNTRIIGWGEQKVETVVSQYAAYLDGRLLEVAYDFFAQADDGSVWYFGEDVFNFKDGAISDTHGSWIAGNDGPAAMIMPADPKVGDVYRPENIPGLVFEEVTVKSVDQTFDGPYGPLKGGIVIDEHHMDGTHEEKSFAPGYGEFYISTGRDVEATVLAVPTDALSEPLPAELMSLQEGSSNVFQAARSRDWNAASSSADEMATAWEAYRAVGVHEMIEAEMSGALEALAGAVADRDTAQAQQAAIDVGQSTLDLELRYRPVAEVDLARFDLWLAQVMLDAAVGDAAAVNGDFFTLDYVRDRILHALGTSDVMNINTQLEELNGAVADEDLAAATDTAGRLREALAGIHPDGQ